MNEVQRYTWEDSLIEAERVGILTGGAVNTGLRLARAINWVPNDGRPSGLYWANELAAEVVGVSRASLFRNIRVLKEAGYLLEKGGNLLPLIPQSHFETNQKFNGLQQASVTAYNEKKSQLETDSLTLRPTKSQVETGQSQSDNPYSEDTYTGDSYSENSLSEAAAVVADAPPLPSSKKEFEHSSTSSKFELSYSNEPVEEVPQSQSETEEDVANMNSFEYRKSRTFRERQAAAAAVASEW